jgi:glyoxylase-like metal-dependent hydrolase (beta-lactamase superfamily II)
MKNPDYSVGKLTVTKIWELDLDGFTAVELLPDVQNEILANDPAALDSRNYDPETQKVKLSVHSWLVRDGSKTILIDTGCGNGKDRSKLKALDHLRTPYLARLIAAGVRPEEVDYVLITHLHADHVGWNTQLVGDRWVPTFPNATVFCSDLEWRYAAALASGNDKEIRAVQSEAGWGEPTRTPLRGVFEDSLAPIQEAGLLQRITVDGSELLEGVRFMPTPGHSIDHAAIIFSSQGEEAIFAGDVVHHPLEISHPELVSRFCEFPDTARTSRRVLLNRASETGALFFSGHFSGSSVGRVTRHTTGYGWKFLEDEMD